MIDKPESFVLTGEESCSNLWAKLSKYLEEENARDRARNDDPRLSQEETQYIRARIAVRKSILNLDAQNFKQ